MAACLIKQVVVTKGNRSGNLRLQGNVFDKKVSSHKRQQVWRPAAYRLKQLVMKQGNWPGDLQHTGKKWLATRGRSGVFKPERLALL